MKILTAHQILAVVTVNRDKVGGSSPIFYADNHEELEQVSLYLARVLMAAVHDLGNGSYVIIKH